MHAVASLMPNMSKNDFTTLRDDMRANGQQRPILGINDNAEVLDGRNRLRICAELDIEPVIEWKLLSETGDPVARVISLNLTGRTLTTSQRVMIANRCGRCSRRCRSWGQKRPRRIGKSAVRAAQALKVGTTLVKEATFVQEQAPEP